MGGYYFIFEGDKFELEVPTFDAVVEAMKNFGFSEIVDEAILSIPSRSEPCGRLQTNTAYDVIVSESSEILKEQAANQNIIIYNEFGLQESSIQLERIFLEMLDQRESCEQGTVDEASLVLERLRCFLEEGHWQFGLRAKDGKVLTNICDWPIPQREENGITWNHNGELLTPIIWFGLDENEPITCWTLYREEWGDFWFNINPDNFIYQSVIDDKYDAYYFWIRECTLDVPIDEFEQIRAQCPIQLTADLSDEYLTQSISEYCFAQQKESGH